MWYVLTSSVDTDFITILNRPLGINKNCKWPQNNKKIKTGVFTLRNRFQVLLVIVMDIILKLSQTINHFDTKNDS